MNTLEVGGPGGAGLPRWGDCVTVGHSRCCAEGLGLAVGKAWRTQDTPGLPS